MEESPCLMALGDGGDPRPDQARPVHVSEHQDTSRELGRGPELPESSYRPIIIIRSSTNVEPEHTVSTPAM